MLESKPAQAEPQPSKEPVSTYGPHLTCPADRRRRHPERSRRRPPGRLRCRDRSSERLNDPAVIKGRRATCSSGGSGAPLKDCGDCGARCQPKAVSPPAMPRPGARRSLRRRRGWPATLHQVDRPGARCRRTVRVGWVGCRSRSHVAPTPSARSRHRPAFHPQKSSVTSRATSTGPRHTAVKPAHAHVDQRRPGLSFTRGWAWRTSPSRSGHGSSTGSGSRSRCAP